ncbi:MAG: class II aldolase/adducin family protein [Pseudomonadota bacterium]
MKDKALRSAVIEAGRRMNAIGLNQGTSGNLSVRLPKGRGILVTPSSVPYEAMAPGDVIEMGWDGAWRGAEGRRPSSEWRFHRDILAARPEFGAVVHAHPIHATALACHGRGIEPFHYMVATAGGRDVRCAPYALFGGQELSDLALAALDGRKACLLAHHGLIACGRDLEQALAVAVEVETLAAQYLAACALGEPPLLSDAEIDAVLEKIASGPGYGSA